MSFVTLVVGKIKQHAAHVFLTACFSNVPSVDTHELGDLALPERLHLQVHMQIPASVKLKKDSRRCAQPMYVWCRPFSRVACVSL